jgi:conjugative transfer signal peptidase TraF
VTPRRTRLRILVATSAGLVGLLFGAVAKQTYQLRYNSSRSAPLGWYVIVPAGDVPAGAFVLARPPHAAALLAEQRRYLPSNVPLLKRVAATHGQLVCSTTNALAIDRRYVTRALTRDSLGRPLEAWKGCRRLAADELFLLNVDSAASFDSRYFGPISRDAVVGKAMPLWTW